MLVIFFILLVSFSSCVNKEKGYNLPYDLPNETGTWVSVSDTTCSSPYYLIEDSIYVGYLSINGSPHDFFLKYKSEDVLDFMPTLTGVDIASFEVNINKDQSAYARDKRAVYFPRGTKDGTELFFDGYDAGGVIYYGDISIDGADPYTFQYIGGGYAMDKNNIYFNGWDVPSTDLLTFKVLGKGYAVDKNDMYYRGEKIKWNDHIITALQQDVCPDYLPIDHGMTKDE